MTVGLNTNSIAEMSKDQNLQSRETEIRTPMDSFQNIQMAPGVLSTDEARRENSIKDLNQF